MLKSALWLLVHVLIGIEIRLRRAKDRLRNRVRNLVLRLIIVYKSGADLIRILRRIDEIFLGNGVLFGLLEHFGAELLDITEHSLLAKFHILF